MTLALPTIAARIITVAGFSFPRSLAKLSRMIDDGHCSSVVLAANISSDPVLTALALGRANDGASGEIQQISSAVLMLGLGGVRSMIEEVMPVTERAVRLMAGYWSQSNATGTMCRILANACTGFAERPDDELLHVAGLLHDLGSMVAAIHFTAEFEVAMARLQRGDGPWSTLLKEELGADPGELGALVARAWNLPAPFAACMRHALRPWRAGDQFAPLASLVHVARQLVRGCGFTAGSDQWVDPIDQRALTLLGLSVTRLSEVLDAFFVEMDELELYEGLLIRAVRM